MDKRKHYLIVLDTEAANSGKKVDCTQSMVYDFGWQVVDTKGNVYKQASFINSDIFLDYPEMMNSAYYSKKISNYWEDIKQGNRKLTTLYNIRKELLQDIEEYGVKEISCHNAIFDYSACNATQRYLTKSKYRFFFPYKIEMWDTLKMAKEVLSKNRNYIKFCNENDFLTKANKPRLTAEILYKYITKDLDFVESHTALEDVKIETVILAYLLGKRVKNKALFQR